MLKDWWTCTDKVWIPTAMLLDDLSGHEHWKEEGDCVPEAHSAIRRM